MIPFLQDPNNRLTYFIAGTSAGATNLFTIDGSSGVLSVARNLVDNSAVVTDTDYTVSNFVSAMIYLMIQTGFYICLEELR